MQEPAGQKPPEKRKLLFQEDMLMDFPDVGSLQTSFQSPEEKHLQWLHDLEEKHKIQRMRLRNRHNAEYQKWKEETRLSIDPYVVLPHNSTTAVKGQIHESLLPVLSSQTAIDALKRQGKEYRHVLVSMEQLEEAEEEGEIGKNVGSAYSSVEFAAEVGKMGVNLRRAMLDEKLEMRMFQADEKELVLDFLLKNDPEKYGKRRARVPNAPGTGPAPGGAGVSGMSSRPMSLSSKNSLAQANAGIGGAGLADMFDKSKPRQPLNIKILPTPSGPRPPGSGSRTVTPLTAASTATMAGDNYFSGLPSAGIRDPRLSSKPSEPPKDPRLTLNNSSIYRNIGGGGDGGGTGAGTTAGKNITAASNPSTNAAGKPSASSATAIPSPPLQGLPSKPPAPRVSTVPTTLPTKPMPPPPLAVGLVPVTSIPIAATESPTRNAAPLVPGMSPATPTFPPPFTFDQASGVPETAGVNPARTGEQSGSASVE